MFLPFLSFAKPQKRTFASFSFNPIILWSLLLLLPSRTSSLPLLLPSKPNGASASASSSSSPAYTEEQIAIVRQIRKTKDYYFGSSVLGVLQFAVCSFSLQSGVLWFTLAQIEEERKCSRAAQVELNGKAM
ncbi:hypothetical protein AB3S75_030101 [Citrus x aurantiifolia]